MAGNATPAKGMGTTLSQGTTTPILIGGLTKITPPERARDSKDVTTLDVTDGYKRFLPGLIDGGEITLQGYYEYGDAGQTALETSLDAGSLDTYTITFPATIGATLTFTAFVLKHKIDVADLDTPLGFQIVLKISGKPTLA